MILYTNADVEGFCPETGIMVFSATLRIGYRIIQGGGDDWYEPRYPASVEFRTVERIDDPNDRTVSGMLCEWAEAWLKAHEEDVLADAADDDVAMRESAAERRAEWAAQESKP